MRFFGLSGVLAKARRYLSAGASVHEGDVTDPKKLAELLRATLARLSGLEARVPPEAMEFEVAVSTAGALVTLEHGLSGPVRWWVSCWTRPVSGGAYPAAGPALVQDASTTANSLVLQSYTAGRAVIRVEPSVGVMEA